MKKFIATAAAVLLLSAGAAVAQETDKLTVSNCILLYSGLNFLSEPYKKPTKENKDEVASYKLSGPVRFQIAQAMTALRPFVESVDRARIGIVNEVGKGKKIEEGSPELVKINIEYNKVVDATCGVKFSKIKLSDLNLGDGEGQNPIPPATLSLLVPIIDSTK